MNEARLKKPNQAAEKLGKPKSISLRQHPPVNGVSICVLFGFRIVQTIEMVTYLYDEVVRNGDSFISTFPRCYRSKATAA